ncbi:putative replication factor C subunit 1 [Capsicum chacoense]|uniref:probable replication factor C subunit 1 n=1 Tax=Capsicum annuum TaxID=4072 RepID=UPI0007BED1CB|nr:probable replication factor C subunit 1 [Capsicum annuum]KAF3626674.1 putative 30S ribosomal protein S20, chloroplastic-like [Capsicum annuum]KAF3667921.1 putative 30S ribosomal protein S20, chloroplastic-like [Capsicum annuum]
MGERKPSSKKKSYKKKRLKVSSKIRKRKSRRSKSKKFSSSEDDMSSSASSDYSSSPQSSSSSSSEDDYSRKSRRHSRDVKRVKRRTRRRSSSRDVSEDSPPVKKRKKSNRKSLDHGKKVQKKKRKRYTSISSTSRDSRSCSSCRRENSISSRGRDSKSFSTCQDETNSGNEDIHLQIPRIKSRKMKEKKTRNEPSVDIRSGSTEPICSLCNHHSCSCNTTRSGKECAEESNPKRLRSVITISEKTSEEEGDKQGPDMLKEETMNKHHDCPSCRNHDNNDLENKSKPCSCFLSNQTLQIGNLITDDAFPPNSETFGPTKVGGSMDPHSNEVKEVSRDNGGESGKSDNVANTAVEDLETVLRKKALENLQKFRKERINLKSGAKEKKNDSVVNQLSSSKTEVVPYKSPEQEKEEGFALNQVLERRSKLVITEEFSHSAKIGKKNSPVEENNRKGSGCVEQGVTQPSDRSALSQSPEKVDHTTGPVLINQPEPGKPLSSTTVQTYKKENPLASKRNIIKTPVPPLRPGVLSTGTSDNLDTGAVNTSIRPTVESTSSVRSTSDGFTSKHQPDETKDASQFEQKTMSVMRGGEMVQVNYKVYIPQRASALARKPLKR